MKIEKDQKITLKGHIILKVGAATVSVSHSSLFNNISACLKTRIHYSNLYLQYLSGYFKYVKINKQRFSVSSQRFMITIFQRFVTSHQLSASTAFMDYFILILTAFSSAENSSKTISFRFRLKSLKSNIVFG